MEKQINSYAPVIIPTLCRYEHFRNCIESLSHCTGSEYTEVFVGLDYPAKDSHWAGYEKINKYLDNCGNLGFKKINVIKRNRNYGLGNEGNYRSLRDYVFKFNDRIISTEDDNVFSPCFLEYMNKCLEEYENDENIYSICGYLYLDQDLGHVNATVFRAPLFNAWGIGLWKTKIEKSMYYYSLDGLKEMIEDKDTRNFLVTNRLNLYVSLIRMSQGGDIHGDGVMSGMLTYKKMNCIYPTISKVRNMGFDGSGVHCGDEYCDKYSSQKIDLNETFILNEANLQLGSDVAAKQYILDKNATLYRHKIRTLYSWFYYCLTGKFNNASTLWRFGKKYFKRQ